ncbi:PE-PGRS family protein PE_PGRS16-like [Panicum virgatum]|uniref:PE-PGRS family protein PE_PGRS16-like n=1 Tax=Panicum virgatum TaxID=38727 RepID=UPI0019D61600|nr:PE-PGRS family protein PE_PGRS16-like [Panicum virgatum]
MGVKGVALEGEKDEVPPASVDGGVGVEDDRHQGLDVLDTGSLGMKVGDGGGLVVGGGIIVGDRGRGDSKKELDLHQLTSQSGNGGTLVLLGEGRGPLAHLSSGDGRSGGDEGGVGWSAIQAANIAAGNGGRGHRIDDCTAYRVLGKGGRWDGPPMRRSGGHGRDPGRSRRAGRAGQRPPAEVAAQSMEEGDGGVEARSARARGPSSGRAWSREDKGGIRGGGRKGQWRAGGGSRAPSDAGWHPAERRVFSLSTRPSDHTRGIPTTGWPVKLERGPDLSS